MRSPRIAPPVTGLDGSTANDAHRLAFARAGANHVIAQRALARSRRTSDAENQRAARMRRDLTQ